MTFDEWICSFDEDERDLLVLKDAWDAAKDAVISEITDYLNKSLRRTE